MLGKIDEDRQRFSFECSFRDLVKDSQGKINALIIFNTKAEAYFESLTVKMSLPREIEIKITEATDDLNETEPLDPRQFNKPTKGYSEPNPREGPKGRSKR
jgi:hypothetical protein